MGGQGQGGGEAQQRCSLEGRMGGSSDQVILLVIITPVCMHMSTASLAKCSVEAVLLHKSFLFSEELASPSIKACSLLSRGLSYINF